MAQRVWGCNRPMKRFIPVRAIAIVIATVCFTLAAFHFIPTLRYRLQASLVEMDAEAQRSIEGLVGSPYFLHDASDRSRLANSLASKLPSRLFGDIAFWSGFQFGQPFVVEAGGPNAFGITHLFFEREPQQRTLVLSDPTKRLICIGTERAWVVRVAGMEPVPVYHLDASEYVLTLLTDGSDKWKAAEHAC